jgi:hypothetical protein
MEGGGGSSLRINDFFFFCDNFPILFCNLKRMTQTYHNFVRILVWGANDYFVPDVFMLKHSLRTVNPIMLSSLHAIYRVWAGNYCVGPIFSHLLPTTQPAPSTATIPHYSTLSNQHHLPPQYHTTLHYAHGPNIYRTPNPECRLFLQFTSKCNWRHVFICLRPPPLRGGRFTPLSMVRCPLSIDQMGISVKSCPLMAESWNLSVESYRPLTILLF